MAKEKTAPKITFILKYFKKYAALLVGGGIFLILAKVASTVEPIYLRNIINALSDNKFELITSFLLFYFGLRIAAIISELLRDYILSVPIMGVTRDVELAVFGKLLRLPVSYHADQKAGGAARAVARGTRALSIVFDFTITQLLPPVFELIFVSMVLFHLFSWQFGTITLATIAIYTWFTIWATEKRQVLRMAGNEQEDLSGGLFVESIANIETIKYFNSDPARFNLYMKIKDIWFKIFVKNNRLFAVIFSGQGLILWLGLGLIFILAIGQVRTGVMTVGDLILVSTYIVQLSIPITTLGFIYAQFKNSFSDLAAMDEIMSRTEELQEPQNPKTPRAAKGEVEFQDVEFCYQKDSRPILRDLNLTIKPGEKVAFVGPSGAGKSTIVKLLFRLYGASRGSVVIDGVDVADLSKKSRKKLLAIVPQDPALFNDTILNNIKFAKANATMDEIKKAAQVAQINKFINGLSDGYDTVVGERGVKLSGGERQRVAIARAILANPKILVFDEATSSLDTKNEREILRTLDKISKGRTTIAIAHRLSTIVDSDTIYVLKNGRVVEQGTHRDLLKLGSVYAKLWHLQSRAKE
jgi:ATP-binding cassette subfamily B protein